MSLHQVSAWMKKRTFPIAERRLRSRRNGCLLPWQALVVSFHLRSPLEASSCTKEWRKSNLPRCELAQKRLHNLFVQCSKFENCLLSFSLSERNLNKAIFISYGWAWISTEQLILLGKLRCSNNQRQRKLSLSKRLRCRQISVKGCLKFAKRAKRAELESGWL